MRANITIFLILSSAIVFFSCENDNNRTDRIPDVKVNFTLDLLTTPQLQSALQPKYVAYANGEEVGYNGHGIYVTKINSAEFTAFDASCPNEIGGINHADLETHLLQSEKNKMLVYCPKCESKFNLVDGNVYSGTARFPLKRYKTIHSGNKLRVYN